MRCIATILSTALAAMLLFAPAHAQQARKWVEPDGRVIYSDVQPSKTARLAGSVRADQQGTGAAEKIEAGKVEFIDGQVTVSGPAGGTAARRMVTGSILYEGDSVVTGDKGELHAEMADGGVIAVRPNSQMTIVRYRARGQTSDASIMSLLRGSFRSITGFIAKTSSSAYEVRTPLATIGVRGTDHEPMVVPAGSTDAQPGVYDKVNIGSTTITANNGGSVAVAAGQAGFAASGAGAARPAVLPSVPAAFRGSANDGRMQGRHASVQQGLGEKRTQAAAGQGMQKGGPGGAQGQGGQGGKGGPGGQGAGAQGQGKGGAGQAGPGGQGGSGQQGGQGGPGGQGQQGGPGGQGQQGGPGGQGQQGGPGGQSGAPGGGGAPGGPPAGGGSGGGGKK